MSPRSWLIACVAALAAGAAPVRAGDGGSASGEPAAPARRHGHIETVAVPPPEMVRVPAGRFTMGPDDAEQERVMAACNAELGLAAPYCSPGNGTLLRLLEGTVGIKSRRVLMDEFELDRREVTTGQYRSCVAAGACDVAALVAGDPRYLRDEWPMVNVTWQDAVDYCAWRGKQLPTEAQWERAARGDDGRRWPWGNHPRKDGANHGRVDADAIKRGNYRIGAMPSPPPTFAPDDSDGALYAVPPGSMPWTEGPYGARDMAGNVSEWVADYFSARGYVGLSHVDPVRDTPLDAERRRVIRGGSWYDPQFRGRTYVRDAADPTGRWAWVGFRCARARGQFGLGFEPRPPAGRAEPPL